MPTEGDKPGGILIYSISGFSYYMRDIVIYCPGETHKELKYHKIKNQEKVVPKILLIVSRETTGKIKVQCNDGKCKRSGGDDYNGWYEVDIKGYENYTVRPIKRKFFDVKEASMVVMGDN